MRYAIMIEKADGNYSAYVPDLPGCVAAGDTVAAAEREIRDATAFISRDCSKTVCRCPRRPAWRSMLRRSIVS